MVDPFNIFWACTLILSYWQERDNRNIWIRLLLLLCHIINIENINKTVSELLTKCFCVCLVGAGGSTESPGGPI